MMKNNEKGVFSGGMNRKCGERSGFIELGVEMSYG